MIRSGNKYEEEKSLQSLKKDAKRMQNLSKVFRIIKKHAKECQTIPTYAKVCKGMQKWKKEEKKSTVCLINKKEEGKSMQK